MNSHTDIPRRSWDGPTSEGGSAAEDLLRTRRWQKRDGPEPTKRAVQITRGDGIPPTALEGSCT